MDALKILSNRLFNLSQQIDEVAECGAMSDSDIHAVINDDIMPQLQATLSTLRV